MASEQYFAVSTASCTCRCSMPPRKGNRRLKAACCFIDDQDQPADKRGRNIDSLDNMQTLVQPQMQSDHSNRNVETMLHELVPSVTSMQKDIKQLKEDRDPQFRAYQMKSARILQTVLIQASEKNGQAICRWMLTLI